MSQAEKNRGTRLPGGSAGLQNWKVFSVFREEKGGQCVGTEVSGGSQTQFRQTWVLILREL